MAVISGSYGSSLRNPCPDGTGIGYIYTENSTFLNNSILLVCSPLFKYYDNIGSLTHGLELGLGLGLGLGIPLIILIRLLYTCMIIKNINNTSSYVPPALPTLQDIEEIVKSELPPQLYQQFACGELTNELKKALFELKEKKGRHLSEYITHAHNINQEALAQWICDIKYTTLQDENIV